MTAGRSTPPRDDLGLRGAIVDGKYAVGEQVGAGGFATVYRAEHRIWNAPVALKFFGGLARAPAEQRDALLEAFLQEGRLMADLSARLPHIVQARDVGAHTSEDGRWIPFMVMEWLEGANLDELISTELVPRASKMSIREAMALLEGPAQALAAVHDQGVVHRDIKPANLFVCGPHLDPGVTVKVLDFGVAKVMQEASSGRAATGNAIRSFTPDYGAPEQFDRSYGPTGPWTDVFGFALVLVELLSGGRPPLGGGDLMQMAFASQDPDRRPTPSTLGAEVNDAVDAVFARALAVFPDDRFENMGAFWTALRLAAERGVTADPKGRTTDRVRGDVATGPALRVSASDLGTVGAIRPAGPQRWRAGVGGSVLAAGILVGVVGWQLGVFGAQAEATPVMPVAASSQADREEQSQEGSPPAPVAVVPRCPEDMIFVPGGKMFMGTDEDHPALRSARPAHKVEVDGYCLDRREVTVDAFLGCSKVGECRRPYFEPWWPHGDETKWAKARPAYAELCNATDAEHRGDHPINCVTWSQAVDYCAFAGKRLPSEAEWEYAARGSDGRIYPWGDASPDSERGNSCGTECVAWLEAAGLPSHGSMYDADDGFPGTAPVGSFPSGAGQFGHEDLVGNVFEWVDDRLEPYPGSPTDESADESDPKRVIRGGAFNSFMPQFADPALRFGMVERARSHGIGFRCAK